jgi:hypothetical protein
VQLLTPSAGAVLPLAPVTLAAAAEDVDGAVARVDFYAGTERVGSATAAPWSFRWTPPAPGFYAILAVAIDDDGASAASETRVVTVGNPSPPRLTVGAAAAREGPSAALEFPVRLSAAVPWPVTLRYSTAAGTAREGADYSGGSATLRIPPGLTSAAVRVAVVDDLLDEDDETLRLLPGEIDGAALATAEAVGTIVDDDAPPALELVDARVPEGDRGAALTLPLRLSAPSGRDVVVRYATFDLTASAGSDYAASAGTLTIRAGETRASLAVAIAGDRVFEPDEQLGVRISGSGFVSPRSEAFVTIQNDDAPGLSIGDVRMREPATGSQPAVFTVSLAPPLERAVTVSFATRDGSAHAGSDYVAATGVLTFAPGVATLTVPVTVNADSQREPVEAFAVALRDASGAPIAWPEGDARIVDSRTRGDLDGDGRADILWRRTGGIAKERAEAYLWAMDGTGLAAAHALDSISGEWQVLFTDDFDGDGKTDVLWRNYGAGPDAGKLYVWMMDGPDVVGGTGYTAAQADLGWRVDGVGDLNGDGKADIVWRKTGAGADKGAAFLWLMNGTGLAGARYLDAIGGDWQVVDLGDFNGDGKSDVLWRNFGTGGDAGKLYVWMMDGPNVVGGTGYTAAQADLAWRIDGVGDLDGDGKDDIVWRKTGAGVDKGALFLWTMDGTGLSGARYLDPISEAWQIHGLGDFNGDGMADILWRNQGGGAEAGNVYIWMMDGGSVAAGTGYTAAQADLGWRIDSPRR